MNREELKKLRPRIPSISQEGISSDTEGFQNKTLRPILKFQNELLLEVFRNYIDLRKGAFRKLPIDKKGIYIQEHIKKDHKLNHFFIGIIIGQFTIEEWKDYLFEEKELKKRISNMLIERLQDQVEKI